MGIYSKIYYTLCNNKKQIKEQYGKGSGLHKHHIIPKHSGGTDEEHNITYLTVREHIIAHFLLWKMHRNPLDIGAFWMLGAKRTPTQRVLLGKWCHENKIGVHSDSYKNNKELQRKRVKSSTKSQRENKVGIFNPDNLSKYASIGGKASIRSKNNPWNYWASEEGRLKRASMGGQAHAGKVWLTKECKNTRTTVDKIQEYLNEGWVLGFYTKPRVKKVSET